MPEELIRFAITAGVLVVLYYVLIHLTPFARLTRERQFLVFGGIGFAILLVIGLVWR